MECAHIKLVCFVVIDQCAEIPEHLDINVTELRLGKSIKVGDLSFEGLELVTPKEVVVCSIKATRNSIQAAAAAEAEEAAAE